MALCLEVLPISGLFNAVISLCGLVLISFLKKVLIQTAKIS